MVRQLFTLSSRGVSLEVDVHNSISRQGPDDSPILLVLHPWSWLGGCMDDHVVVAVCRAALAGGRFPTVVRYNMRGAGGSSGSRALLPSVDAADLVALVRHLVQSQPQGAPQREAQQPGGPPRSVALVSYSYGCVVAARALPELRGAGAHVVALAALAFPLGSICRIFLGAGPSWDVLAGPRGAHGLPRLLCWGDRDQFTSVRQLDAAVQKARKYEARAVRALPSRLGSTAAASPNPPWSQHAPHDCVSAPGTTSASAASAAAAIGAAPTPTPQSSASGPPASLSPPCSPCSSSSSCSSLQLVVWPGCDHFFFDCDDPASLAAAGLLGGTLRPGCTAQSPPSLPSPSWSGQGASGSGAAGGAAYGGGFVGGGPRRSAGEGVEGGDGTQDGGAGEGAGPGVDGSSETGDGVLRGEESLAVKPWEALARYTVRWLERTLAAQEKGNQP